MDEEMEEGNSPQDIPQKIAVKRSSSERHEDNESSSSEVKRSKFELSGSSSTQAGSVEMDSSQFVQPPLLAFGSTQAAAAGGMQLSSTQSGDIPPFEIRRCIEGQPLFEFSPVSSKRCAKCRTRMCSKAGLVCPTNMEHIYCLECALHHFQGPLPKTCPSGQNCVGGNSAEPWLINRSLANNMVQLYKSQELFIH